MCMLVSFGSCWQEAFRFEQGFGLVLQTAGLVILLAFCLGNFFLAGPLRADIIDAIFDEGKVSYKKGFFEKKFCHGNEKT